MRKIIQIAYGVSNTYNHVIEEIKYDSELFALCDDGSLWRYSLSQKWVRISDIPQDKGVSQSKDEFLGFTNGSIDELDASVRLLNALKIEGIDTLYKLVNYQGHHLKGIPNLGKISEKELYETLYDLLVKDKLISIKQVRKFPIFNDYRAREVLSNKEAEYSGKA